MIYIENLSAGYDGRAVIHDINLHVARGEFVGIIGPNGGGKTTLIKSILGLIEPVTGKICFRNAEGKYVPRLSVGYLPQRKDIDTLFPITVEEVVLSGLMHDLGWFRRPSLQQKRRVGEILDMVGMKEFRNFSIGALSGGQMQRVMVGRAIIQKPELLVLDEPNSYLDMAFEQQLYRLLSQLNAEGTTILMVSHEMASLGQLVSRVISVEASLKSGSLECPYCHTS